MFNLRLVINFFPAKHLAQIGQSQTSTKPTPRPKESTHGSQQALIIPRQLSLRATA
jgi:hypothetical protein